MTNREGFQLMKKVRRGLGTAYLIRVTEPCFLSEKEVHNLVQAHVVRRVLEALVDRPD